MPGMLEDIIERTKEAADSYLSQSHARMNGVQIGPVGIDWTYVQEAQGNWRTCMNGIFRQLEKHGIGLLSKRPIESFPIKTLSFCSRCCPILAPSRISEIAKRMGVASNYASQYKRRLLEDGVIGERGRGLVGFDIPAFREFLNEKAF